MSNSTETSGVVPKVTNSLFFSYNRDPVDLLIN